MEATLKVKLHPMNVPNYINAESPAGTRQEGFAEGPKYHVRDLEPETLEALCVDYRKRLFENAGKKDPAKTRATAAPRVDLVENQDGKTQVYIDGVLVRVNRKTCGKGGDLWPHRYSELNIND